MITMDLKYKNHAWNNAAAVGGVLECSTPPEING